MVDVLVAAHTYEIAEAITQKMSKIGSRRVIPAAIAAPARRIQRSNALIRGFSPQLLVG